jgi:hypothetical protein
MKKRINFLKQTERYTALKHNELCLLLQQLVPAGGGERIATGVGGARDVEVKGIDIEPKESKKQVSADIQERQLVPCTKKPHVSKRSQLNHSRGLSMEAMLGNSI